jgi:hypothetical protein
MDKMYIPNNIITADNIITAGLVFAVLLLIAGFGVVITALVKMGESTEVPPGTSKKEEYRIRDEYQKKQEELLEDGGWVLLSGFITFVISLLAKYIYL